MDKATYRKQKSALTRAVNSGDPLKVLKATREAFAVWNQHGNYYPDDWHRWNVAEGDAILSLQRDHQWR